MVKAVTSFEPIIDKNSRVLILGTMPGPESLRKKQYYANPRNQFWKIIYSILIGCDEPPSDYHERVKFLRRNGIALWDVLESCEREGANDSQIRKGRPNDFKKRLQKTPNLRRIFFNGGAAGRQMRKVNGLDPKLIENEPLPSTSPANTLPLSSKMNCWQKIRDLL